MLCRVKKGSSISEPENFWHKYPLPPDQRGGGITQRGPRPTTADVVNRESCDPAVRIGPCKSGPDKVIRISRWIDARFSNRIAVGFGLIETGMSGDVAVANAFLTCVCFSAD
jgi:hypothetical protein